MKTKFNGILTLLLAFTVHFAFAQKTVSGTVSDDSGPLPGVSVLIKGTTTGTETDFDGKYSLQANAGDVLQFSYIGLETVFKTVGTGNTYNIKMHVDAENVLDEVVVTAQGIKKEKKALGYAVSSVKEDQIKDKAEADLTRVLSGKSAGVNITSQNGLAGSSNKIIIRGMNSFNGDNNALYVIDGVPISNDTNEAGNFISGNMGSSRSFDIDPNNIEKIDILKGLAAASLYGTAGRNGVVLITTKSGSHKGIKNKQEIQISSSYFFSEVASLPDYQNEFGGGYDQGFGWYYSNWGPGFYEKGLGGWGSDGSFDEDGTLVHPYASSAFLAANYPDFQQEYIGKRYDWKPRNSVRDFFRIGGTSNISANLKGRSEDSKFTYGMNFSNLADTGFTPGNEVSRSNFSLSGSAQLSNKINFSSALNYSRTNYITPPVAQSSGSSSAYSSIFGDLFYTPRSVDMFELPFELPDGSSIYYRDENAIQHPLWTIKNAQFSQLTNRVFGNANVNFNLNSNLNLSYKAALDMYSEDNINRQNRGGRADNPSNPEAATKLNSGIYNTWNNNNVIWDHSILLNGRGYSYKDMSFSFDLGATVRSKDFNQLGIKSYDQKVFGFFDHKGFQNRGEIEYHEKRNIMGVFGQLAFDYNNMFFINLSARNDWVSNMVNNTKFYPSISGSFIPTKAFEWLKSEKGINFLKLRVGYGTSANFATGYPTASNISLNTQLWGVDDTIIVGNTTSASRANRLLKPELIAEIEYGIEGRLFRRVNFDFSYYTRNTTDLIIDQPIPASSGYTMTQTNIGKITGYGYEADLGIDLFKNESGFNWNSNVNFNKSDSEVVDLGVDTDIIMYAGYTNLGNGARKGYSLTSMFGSRVARNDNGDLLVDNGGNYVRESVDEENILPFIGDSNPDFVMNYSNSFSYKNLSFSFSINHTSGGNIYSQTISTLMGRGLTTDTLEGRLGTFVLPGVNQDTGEVNTIQLNNSGFYFDNLFASNIEELSVYDASVIRLQEVSLGYTISDKLLKRTPFGKITIKASGYNMWYNAYNTPAGINFDPNTTGLGAGNGSGFEYMTGPSGKKYGLSVNLTF